MTRRSMILSSMLALSIALTIAIRLQHTSVKGAENAFASWNLRESVSLANPLQKANGGTLENARLVRAAIMRSDFETAERLTQNVLKAGHLPTPNVRPIKHFLDVLIDPADLQFETQLSGWVQKCPDSMVAHLLRAKFHYDAGWFRRGHGYVSTVSEQGVQEFVDDMHKSELDIDRALQLDANEPYLQLLRLEILHGSGYSDKMGQALQDSISKFPTFFPPYDVVLSALQPKWGGNVDVMFSFVDHFKSTDPNGIATKLLDLDVYRYLLSTASSQCQDDRENSDYQRLSECVREFMKTNMTGDREGRVVEALSELGQRDNYIATKAVEDVLSSMIDTAGSETYAGPVLQAAANGYESDTRLREDSNSHNHYMIDSLVAKTWLRQGNLDNALSKYQEALRDLLPAKFPSTEEQDAATAAIKEQMAKVYAKQRRYADSVDVAQEAVALGASSDSQLLVCYGYFQQKKYEAAVDECAELANDQANGMTARYWRGSAFRELHDDDNAIKEFSAVAASKNGWRASAAIGLSMIYFGRNDNPEALNVLNKYDYLYDVKSTGKDDVAVAFNNRCYAHMELGDLKKALEDCTASLANGNIPDAYKKQQELLKRIAAR
ncbi:tetratricopeptide repeat protein [Rhizobium mayense]|uniref:Tetratricopeptide repeat protein n=1 Tax=Rhizobium mayense TaxID=1312184 RepID=A0ABT7JWR0_9HYPH|nr:hypothetical protein [Rhizobium mayense]MDL2400783.1 hypothetical protein [Rhizobium mayense]